MDGSLPLSSPGRQMHRVRRRSLDVGVGGIAVLLIAFALTGFAAGAFHYDQAAESAKKTATTGVAAARRKRHHQTKTSSVPFYYREWHAWGGGEFWGLVVVFLALPVAGALIMTRQNTKPFERGDLPQYELRSERAAEDEPSPDV